MAPPDRRRPLDLIALLEATPQRFRFVQALRLLEAASGRAGAGRLRLRTPASLAFPPSEVLALARTRGRLELTIGFLGLTGPSGVLPRHYTELLMERRDLHRDDTAHAFLDLFSHRAAILFHAAWRKHRPHPAWEPGEGPFARRLRALAGLPNPVGRTLAAWAGTLARRPLPGAALAAILGAGLGAPVVLEPFRGQWQDLPAEAQARLGGPERSRGFGRFLGRRLWERQTRIGLRLGPLDPEAFREFLPGRPRRRALEDLVRTLLGHSLACDLTLVLGRGGAPAPRLGGPDVPAAPRLGINLWLPGSPSERDLDDARFRLA